MKIPLLKPSCSQAEVDAVTKVLRSGWWGTGKVTEELEDAFAKRVGSKYAIAVNSCTSALHLAVRFLRINTRIKNGNIVVPALTFVSTAMVGLYEGLEIRFADIREDSLCMNLPDAMAKRNRKTVAIIPVHYAGNYSTSMMAEMEGVPVIEDCAHCSNTHGWTDIQCFSFHAVKNIACGGSGMITTNDIQIAEGLKKMRWLGISKTTYNREEDLHSLGHDISMVGYKYDTNDIESAICLEQLKRLDEMNKKREQIAIIYNTEFIDLPIKLPPTPANWYLYVIRVANRDNFVKYLRSKGVSAGIHYRPLNHYPIFPDANLPVTERVYKEIVTLPMYPDMTEDEQGYVVDAIREWFE